MPVTRFILGRRVLLEDAADPPRRGDEVGIDGAVYFVARVVWHRPMCPPDTVNVHLTMGEPDTAPAPL